MAIFAWWEEMGRSIFFDEPCIYLNPQMLRELAAFFRPVIYPKQLHPTSTYLSTPWHLHPTHA
jgi:hypothetical protein